jgi:hypothetical protein
MTRSTSKRAIRGVGLALTAMALSAPLAQARVDEGTGVQRAEAEYVQGVTDFPNGAAETTRPSVVADPEPASTSGFHWSDFGLGAAAGIAAAAVAGGALILMGRSARSGRRGSPATVA